MAGQGALSKLRALLAKEAPKQQDAAIEALHRAAKTGHEHSVVGSADFGPVGRITTSGNVGWVEPNMLDISRARRTNSPIFDMHTHPSDTSIFNVAPSFEDLSYYAGNYNFEGRPGISDRRLRTLIASPPSREQFNPGRTGYSFFETDDPARVFNRKMAQNARYDLQRAAAKGRFDSVFDRPAFQDFLDYDGDKGEMIEQLSTLMYLARQADKGLGRQEVMLSGRKFMPNATNVDAYNELRGPLVEFLRESKYRHGGRVGALNAMRTR